ncbi:MAG: hypothetical protein R3265_03570 [Hyphomonas sp.]|nr:hypothetical protein [Hyphomonas sp.]
MTRLKPLRIAGLAALAMMAAGAASAGEWKLDPARCPDLREDRIDRRVDYGRADRREDVRDMRRISCPASAWTYVPAPGERIARKMAYSGPRQIYVGRHGYYHTVAHRHGHAPDLALINIVIR